MKLLLTVQYISDRDSRVMDEVGFRIPRVRFRIPDSGFQSPGFRIPKAKKWWIPDSGFPYKGQSSGIITQLLPGATRPYSSIYQPFI